MASDPTTWLDPSIWENEHSHAFRAATAELSRDDMSFIRACFAVACGSTWQLLSVGESFVTMLPGFPGASEKAREAGRKIINMAVQAARAGEGAAHS